MKSGHGAVHVSENQPGNIANGTVMHGALIEIDRPNCLSTG